MSRNWKPSSYFWEDVISFMGGLLVAILLFITFMAGIAGIATAYTRANIKYNCQLDEHPGWILALWIDTSPYAYEPEKFCADIRKRMIEGE